MIILDFDSVVNNNTIDMSNIGNTGHDNIYNRNRHSVYCLRYHLVVVTKYRHPVIDGRIRERLLEITGETFRKWKCNVISAEGSQDHLHVYFSAPPQLRLSDLVNNYKTVSARLIRKEFASELAPYYWKPFFWSRSYFLSTVSEVDDKTIRNYIENQNKDDAP